MANGDAEAVEPEERARWRMETPEEAAEREVNILATFSHPNIIRYDHAFVRQGQLNIVMEHASGGDLANHLRSLVDAGERPSIAQSLDWFVQLLLALECVHACRVLHRDVALKNVFLADGGVLKLGDFGVARVMDHTGIMTAETGTYRWARRRARGVCGAQRVAGTQQSAS